MPTNKWHPFFSSLTKIRVLPKFVCCFLGKCGIEINFSEG